MDTPNYSTKTKEKLSQILDRIHEVCPENSFYYVLDHIIQELPNDYELGYFIRNITRTWKDLDAISYDKCVICQDITPFKKTTDIDYRMWYIEGAGQLCKECYVKHK